MPHPRRAAVVLGILACSATMPWGGTALARPRCPPGSYEPLLDPIGLPLENVASPSEALAIGTDSVALGVCGTAPATFRTGHLYTRIHAVWPACPRFGRVRLRGFLQAPPGSCKPLVVVMRWRDQTTGRRRALKFEALRLDEP